MTATKREETFAAQADLLRRANHKSPYPPLDRAVAKALRQSRGGLRRRMLQARRVARLDFTPQRCSLTVSDGDIARRRRFTFLIYRLDRNVEKASGAQFSPDLRHIMVAMRHARHEGAADRRETPPPVLA